MALTYVVCIHCKVQTSNYGNEQCDRCWELYRRIEAAPDLALAMLFKVKEQAAYGRGYKQGVENGERTATMFPRKEGS